MYTTTETDIDLNDETQELLQTVNRLQIENEQLGKSLREKEHILTQTIKSLTMENENLNRSLKNAETLISTYKSQQDNENSKDQKVEELSLQISELESKLFESEQNEMNLKRHNQNLMLDIGNLNIEIDRLRIGKTEKPASVLASSALVRKNTADSHQSAEETSKIITELMNDVEELKKENNDISEKALNMLTEKELLIMELRDHVDEVKSTGKSEINKLMGIINDLRQQIEDNEYNNADDESVGTNDEAYRDLQVIHEDLRAQYEELANLYKQQQQIEEAQKGVIADLEIELTKMKSEVTMSEVNRFNLEKELYSDDKNHEIEILRSSIGHLEEQKDKADLTYKEHMEKCEGETKELKESYKTIKEQKAEVDKEITNLKSQLHRLDIELREKQASMKEVSQIKRKLEQCEGERDGLKKDLDMMRKINEKSRSEYIDLSEDLKRIKDYNENEIQKWEEKYYILEKGFEAEKLQLLERNKELVGRLGNRLSVKSSSSEVVETMNTLSNMLENEDEDDREADRMKISILETEISNLNQKLIEANSKLNGLNKLQSQFESLRKENNKLKSDQKEVKDLYEKQIETIQQKALQTSAELQSTRKRATSVRNDSHVLSPNQIHILADLQVTMNKLIAENKYLTESVGIAHKQAQDIKVIKDNDINFLKEEVQNIEEQYAKVKLDLASMAFEKDSEIIQLRKSAKKYKQKCITLLEQQTKCI
jgi:chromosome segregation ATPase